MQRFNRLQNRICTIYITSYNQKVMKTIEIAAKISIFDEIELTNSQKKVIEAAKQATTGAYAPYSHFHVGAACLLDNGEIISGSNQENAAYPNGICAERTTLFYALAKYPEAKVLKLAVVACDDKGIFTTDIAAPCGACRQVIYETECRSNGQIEILLPTESNGTYVFRSIKDLLPFAFGPTNLI